MSFPQSRAGLRRLERWAKRFPERRWAMENARGLGRHLAGRLAATGESVVDVPPKLSARVRVLSSGNARKNDGREDLVAERTRALKRLHAFLRDLLPGGVAGKLSARLRRRLASEVLRDVS